MNPRARVRTIRSKLDRLVVLSVGLALLIAGALSVWSEADRYLLFKRETLLATAQAFGAAASKAVAAGDGSSVTQAIRGIARVPGIASAEVHDEHGRLLSSLGSAVRLRNDAQIGGEAEGSLFRMLMSGSVQTSVPVVDGGEVVGRLTLVGDTSDLPQRFAAALATAGAGSALALCLGLVLSHRLQRAISRPLTSLAAAMTSVGRDNGYRPVDIRSDDEIGVLAEKFNHMIGEVRQATDEILSREDEIIMRLSRAGEQRDDHTGQHVLRVARVSRLIAEELRLEQAYVEDLCRASPMHDVGKISVPDAILFKPGRLDPAERATMEEHAAAGHRILSGSKARLVQLAAEIALTHHERWDGTGYPAGLKGEAIPLSGRITAVADVCDALLSARPYKPAWPLETVRAYLQENAGLHFDPACVEALLARWRDLEAIYASEPIAIVQPAAA